MTASGAGGAGTGGAAIAGAAGLPADDPAQAARTLPSGGGATGGAGIGGAAAAPVRTGDLCGGPFAEACLGQGF